MNLATADVLCLVTFAFTFGKIASWMLLQLLWPAEEIYVEHIVPNLQHN